MRISRRRRCTRRSLPSTHGRSTKKPILARAERSTGSAIQGRLHLGTALLLCALIVSACSGSKKTTPLPASPPSTGTVIAASSTPALPPPDLASQIGVRADLPTFDPIDLAA